MPSASAQAEASAKQAGPKNKKQGKSRAKQKADDKVGGDTSENIKTNNKSLVDELKLFQNSNLLNQQDPLEQLHQQISQLIQDDDYTGVLTTRLKPTNRSANGARVPPTSARHQSAGPEGGRSRHQQPNQATPSMMQCNSYTPQRQQQLPMEVGQTNAMSQANGLAPYDSGQDVFTVKKGVLWQQQNHEKFTQRLFSRWKKRYFILTTDYLVCFKRSSARVGHSEMGRFLYKISLADVAKTQWLRPKKTDKGAIVLHVKDQYSLFLWSKKELDDWMLAINESLERLRLRRTKHMALNGFQTRFAPTGPMQGNGFNQGVYENAIAPKGRNSDTTGRVDGGAANMETDGEFRGRSNHSSKESISNCQPRASSRASSGARRPQTEATDEGNSKAPLFTPTESDLMQYEMQDKANELLERQRSAATSTRPEPAAQHNDVRRSADSKSPVRSNGPAAAAGSSEAADRLAQGGSANHSEAGNFRNQPDEFEISRTSDQIGNSHENDCASDERFADGSRELGVNGPTGNGAVERQSGRLERPTNNLIRRDDSWHSLVSLTQVGKGSIPVGQRQPLYARHITPANDRPGANSGQFQRQREINIESTATPLRGRLPARQHSIQSYSPRLQPIGQQQQAHSFDVPSHIPNSPSLHGANRQTASHHQRLLQLQLLHNSNNVDYIRTNGGEDRNDYRVYGPESVATSNHYGYYSMRSNLKSAASEFSFIRPNSSSFQQQQQQQLQQQLKLQLQLQQQQEAQPMTPMRLVQENSSYILSEPSVHGEPRGPMVLANQMIVGADQNNNYHPGALAVQKVVRPDTADTYRHENALPQQSLNGQGLVEIVAPQRELPLKPNKRRAANGDQQPLEGSSFGSSIVCFFKRAFSRRSKRNPKLVESCSSSLAAFDSNLDRIQVAQSAFSTGSKSARAASASANQQPGQPQRMIDLIEAFASKTALDQQYALPAGQHQPLIVGQQQQQQQQDRFGSIRPKPIRDQVGSPLHKSNSISTSSGFGGLNELAHRNQRIVGSENVPSSNHMPSPLITRSTKVMSANLTPLFAQRRPHDQVDDAITSPRNPRHLPRPSSIYGQPSLISSPVIGASGRNGDNFGQHRSSMHGGNYRDRVQNIDFRRQRTINAPFLDTTKEVAEELSSPSAEMRELLPKEQLYDHEINARLSYSVQDSSLVRSSRIDPFYRHHQRQAVVNPILQSPTMNAIYDNHHSTPTDRRAGEFVQSSHYDNHRGTSIHDPARDASGYSRPQIMMPGQLDNPMATPTGSPFIHSGRSSQSYLSQNALYTPTREAQPARHQNALMRFETADANRVFVSSKPAAIVAPTTPQHRQASLGQIESSDLESSASGVRGVRYIGQASPMRTNQTSAAAFASPMAARRPINQSQLPYQQSPLVDEQTRILKRGDRVQTTTLSENAKPTSLELGSARANPNPRPTASLLLGQNAGSAQLTEDLSNQPGSRMKTSILSSHAQSAVAESEKCSSDGGETIDKQTFLGGSSQEDKSPSTGSRSANSSVSGQSRTQAIASALASGDEAEAVKSKTAAGEFEESKSKRKTSTHGGGRSSSHSSGGRRRGSSTEQSSTEQSDELSSQAGSIGEPDERNWVNSKLMQQ